MTKTVILDAGYLTGTAMTGLRAQQKAARRVAISQAAMGLFESQGYQATTLEQIARLAGVSVPTVFVYFTNKQEIFLETLREADHRALIEIREEVYGLDDPVDALCLFETSLVKYGFSMLPAALWKEVLPSIIGQLGLSGEGLPEAYRQVNGLMVKEIERLLLDLQLRGLLRADLDVGMVAIFLNDYGHVQFLRLANQENPNYEGHAQEVRRVIDLMFQGMAFKAKVSN